MSVRQKTYNTMNLCQYKGAEQLSRVIPIRSPAVAAGLRVTMAMSYYICQSIGHVPGEAIVRIPINIRERHEQNVWAQQALFAKEGPLRSSECRCPLTHLPTSETWSQTVDTCAWASRRYADSKILRYRLDAQSHMAIYSRLFSAGNGHL